MSRPKNKPELQQLSAGKFDTLMHLLESYNTQQLKSSFPEQYMNRNVRDVLGHLHHWHLMLLDWYRVGMSGKKPDMPAKGYTWKMTPELNKAIQKRYSNTGLASVSRLLKDSHEKVQNIINSHTNEELFEKKRYAWTGSTSLGQYLVSATSSHYDWAIRLIKKCLG